MSICQIMDDFRPTCDPCMSEDISSIAVARCEDCEDNLCHLCRTCHIRSKASKHHKVRGIPIVHDVTNELEEKRLRHLTHCRTHGDHELLYMCNKHGELCCHQCIINHHHHCESIVHLEDIVKREWDVIGDRLEHLTTKTAYLDTRAATIRDKAKAQERDLDDAEDEIKHCLKLYKEKIDAAFKRTENAILEDFAKHKKDAMRGIANEAVEIEKFENGIKAIQDDLSVAVCHRNPIHRYVVAWNLEKAVASKESEVRDKETFTKSPVVKIDCKEVVPVEDIEQLVTKAFDIKTTYHTIDLGLPFGMKAPKLIDKLHLCPVGYKGRLNAKKCVWVNDYIVVVVEGPNVLYCVDGESGKLISTLQCPSLPTSIRVWAPNQLVACLPDLDSVLFCEIHEGELVQTNVSQISPSSVDMIRDDAHNILICHVKDQTIVLVSDQRGNELSEIDLNEVCCKDETSSHNIEFDADAQVLCISCLEHNKVTGVRVMDGGVVFEYKNKCLQYPCSPAVDNEGNIYIPGTGPEHHSLHQINSKGKLIRELLVAQVDLPWSLSFHPSGDKLAVTDKSKDAQLKIYYFQ